MSNDELQTGSTVGEEAASYPSPSGLDPNRLPTETEKRIWVTAWRRAAVELERIRTAELRALDDETGTRLATYLGLIERPRQKPGSGIGKLHELLAKAVARPPSVDQTAGPEL